MKSSFFIIPFLFFFSWFVDAQSQQGTGTPVGRMQDQEKNTTESTVTTIEDGFSYAITAEGIKLSISKKNISVRLFDLTGQLLWSGQALQGSFLIPVNPGIYILRMNHKSHKIICK
ncbi:MAG: T9SS type A sorting domain-containing protein [Prevotellaceae bacterium]|jgi:hypothetical protein|nr:T9SS type A sorting domain-containing protein [Prevotellaceae bacterium]